MKTKHVLFSLLIGALAVSGCKTDSEDDLPGWGGNIDDKPTSTGVVFNEICGKQNPDDDWIELYNMGAKAFDLGNTTIIKTDEDGLDETIYTFPADAKIAGGGYLVIATLTGELQAGISNSKEVGLTLVDKSGKVLDMFNRDSDVGKDVPHNEGGSYARIPDGTGRWTVADKCTRGSSNTGGEPVSAPAVVLNEVCGLQDPDDDWIELYNAGTEMADISGMRIVKTDEDGIDEDIYTAPEGTTIAAGEHLVIATLTGELQAGISNKKEVALTLIMPDGTVLDKFDRDVNIGVDKRHEGNGSYARIPDGTGQWAVTATCTRGEANR